MVPCRTPKVFTRFQKLLCVCARPPSVGVATVWRGLEINYWTAFSQTYFSVRTVSDLIQCLRWVIILTSLYCVTEPTLQCKLTWTIYCLIDLEREIGSSILLKGGTRRNDCYGILVYVSSWARARMWWLPFNRCFFWMLSICVFTLMDLTSKICRKRM